jgi:putative intracellular protease/amidase
MNIAIFIYNGFTALDAIGPYEVLRNLPNAKVIFVAKEAGMVCTESGMLTIMADLAIRDMPSPNMIVISGGPGQTKLMNDDEVLSWIRKAHETSLWTTSVCTGSLLLGAAGLLTGKKATSHWLALEQLPKYGAIPTFERVVEQDKIITAAGVSAGIDMALTLAAKIAGDTVAQAIQLGIEYDPQPPFDAGSPSKAASQIVEQLRARSQFILQN